MRFLARLCSVQKFMESAIADLILALKQKNKTFITSTLTVKMYLTRIFPLMRPNVGLNMMVPMCREDNAKSYRTCSTDVLSIANANR